MALLVIVAVLPALLSATMEQWRHSIVVAPQIGLFLTHSMVEVQKRITSSIQQTLSTHGAGTLCLNCEASTAATCAVYPPAAVFISLLVS